MPDGKIQLPKGFKLDTADEQPVKLPQGFTLDTSKKKMVHKVLALALKYLRIQGRHLNTPQGQ